MIRIMPRMLIYFLLMTLLLFSSTVIAKQVLKIGIGNFPPFFIEQDMSGIFIEVTNEIFKHLPEYSVQYIVMSNSRLAHEMNSGNRIDAACNIFANSNVDAHLSLPIFRFTDVAITKNSSQMVINTVADLKDKSIAAYQGAKELLGSEFAAMAINNPQYSEHSHPNETTFLMLSDSKEVRVGDINIFWHDLKRLQYKDDPALKVSNFKVHRLWPDVYSHIAFKDPKIRDAFNKVIIKLKHSGKINKIYEKYQL